MCIFVKNYKQMYCESIDYVEHAIIKMAARNISTEEVEWAIKNGEIVRDYPDDKPHPSKLLLAFVSKRPIHIVVAKDVLYENCIVITVYEPTIVLWESDFKTKKLK
jgi:hypothetical protein